MRRPALRFLLKIFFSLVLLVLLLHTVDMGELWRAAKNIQIGLLLLAVCMFFPTQLFSAYRWYFLLQALGSRSRYLAVVRYTMLGQFSALFLPGQISGDIVRATAIAHQEQQYAQSFLSLVLDKLTLLFAISLSAFVGAQASPVLSRFPGLVLASAAVCAGSLVGIGWFALYRDSRAPEWLLVRWPRLPRMIKRLLREMTAVFTTPRLGPAVVLWTILCALGLQALNTLGSFVLAQAMHLTIDPLDWMSLNAVVAIVQILPISIGGLGVREGTFVFLLAFYGVQASHALAFSLITFILIALLVTLDWIIIEALAVRQAGDIAHMSQRGDV